MVNRSRTQRTLCLLGLFLLCISWAGFCVILNRMYIFTDAIREPAEKFFDFVGCIARNPAPAWIVGFLLLAGGAGVGIWRRMDLKWILLLSIAATLAAILVCTAVVVDRAFNVTQAVAPKF